AIVKARREAEEAKDALATKTKEFNTKYDAKVKELGDASAKELQKQADAHATALKAEQAKTATAVQLLADQKIAFEKQLTNAVAPSQAVDIWLPVLADLRRPADADAATPIIDKALESSAVNSEEKAKAQTAKGMTLLLKGDLAGAKSQFQTARRNPSYSA